MRKREVEPVTAASATDAGRFYAEAKEPYHPRKRSNVA